MTPLEHGPGCAGDRVEQTDSDVTRPRLGEHGVRDVTGTVRVHRCLDCGAQLAEWLVPLPRIEPGTAGWRWAWQHRPDLIAEQLSPAERSDLTANPFHPHADRPPLDPLGAAP